MDRQYAYSLEYKEPLFIERITQQGFDVLNGLVYPPKCIEPVGEITNSNPPCLIIKNVFSDKLRGAASRLIQLAESFEIK